MQCVRLFTFLLRCGPEAAIFVASKMAATILRKVTENVNKSAHCIVVDKDSLTGLMRLCDKTVYLKQVAHCILALLVWINLVEGPWQNPSPSWIFIRNPSPSY